MTLPQETEKEILKFAIPKRDEMEVKMKADASANAKGIFLTGYLEGVSAGATEWAGKAQGLVDALPFIYRMTFPGTPERNASATALAKYKEVSNA